MEVCEIDDARIELWEAMADQFLDTEMRHRLPHVALVALELGLDPIQAHYVWLNEVTPAVGFNLREIAGEWGGWDRQWLVRRIRHRRRCSAWPVGRALGHLLRAREVDGTWESIRRLMAILGAAPQSDRAQLAGRLGSLACHYFAIGSQDYSRVDSRELESLRKLWPSPGEDALRPAAVGAAKDAGRRRVESALRRQRGGCPPSRRYVELRRARAEMVSLLDRIIELVANSADFCWSYWADRSEAIGELRQARGAVSSGDQPQELNVWFLPTGNLQEVSLQNGWADEYVRIATRFDAAWKKLENP